MSFSDQFNSCMRSHGMPAPVDVFDSVVEFLDFLHKLESAATASGIEISAVTVAQAIAMLEASGGIAVEVGEAILLAVGVAASIGIEVYKAQCIQCLASSAFDALRAYASNETDSWLGNSLATLGIDVNAESVA
jgi:hypothetical protein